MQFLLSITLTCLFAGLNYTVNRLQGFYSSFSIIVFFLKGFSVAAVAQAGGMQEAQKRVINETVLLNEDIAGDIQPENGEFSNVANIIAKMVQSNTQQITTIFDQADTMDRMVKN